MPVNNAAKRGLIIFSDALSAFKNKLKPAETPNGAFEFQDIKKYLETVEVWFGKSAELRKQELLGDNEEIQFDTDFE